FFQGNRLPVPAASVRCHTIPNCCCSVADHPLSRRVCCCKAMRAPAPNQAMTLVSIPANPVPEDVVSGTLKTSDGVELRYARWAPPPGQKGTVCLFQGRAEFIEKYFETVRDLRTRGFAVATLDWRGQGGSQRALKNPRKGYVRSFDEYHLDLETFIH